MAKTTMTVKDFSVKYKVSAQEIIKELNSQGIDTPKGDSSKIPEDMIELVDAYLMADGTAFNGAYPDWSNRDADGTFVFSDSETVVRYHPDVKVLEYYNYENRIG